MASIFSANPLRGTWRYLQRSAHEQPVVFYSLLIGAAGPVAVVAVPPIRRAYGWQPTERIPTTYPLPQREREAISQFDDEEE
ncbi:hypothetical protein FA09DRAFT_332502 [Tilletiopsis washingtonensis]|uniref:NADH-ubiquinone oxidoreductase 9.5 kDa subunit n=1 Tax=Tilletiopsis washingtonensis TaxID=58919 RepID=A0A316YZG1_9BASI|nr:hypothetical protein FA09DRAFT_332502 [Tilletiopsis washingtonensis]PWN94837.1 hypothetical protein FA09DRAFT_332502 [Tilletiopsis washingtonensis]